MNVYDLGDLVALTGRFYSDAALTTLADPTTVTLSIRDPDRVITTPAPTRSSTGIYTYSWVPAKAGLHEYNWSGTGSIYSADQSPVYIKVGINPGTDLTTLAAVRGQLRKQSTDTDDDDILEGLIAAASGAIRDFCERTFTPDPANPRTHRFNVGTSRRLVDLAPFDLQSASSVVLNPQSSSPQTLVEWTDYTLLPLDGSSLGTHYQLKLEQYPYPVGNASVIPLDITGTWGAASIPAIVAKACDITVAEWYRGKVTAFSTTFNVDTQSIERPATLPAAVCGMLWPYKRLLA